ncbi:MAG: putative oxidoreductase C-terminal domain-containing protein, partial [Bryobacteraceae bacterium]
MVLDPGHFHAALMQKETLPGVSEMVHVFAPLGTDLSAHLNRVSGFNHRAERPTHWLHRIYAGPDFLDRMIAEHPGNVVILSGRNQGKIVAIQRALTSGINVMGDKPWVIEPEDLAKLELALKTSRIKKVAAYDAMTQRYEISCILQRELVNDEAVFGKPVQGTKEKPAVTMESVHYLLKLVAGVPNLRPAWFFDVRQ